MTTPCDRLDALLATSPESAAALPTLESALATHAETCPRCQAALARNEALVRQLQTLHADFVPASDLLAKVHARAASKPPSKRPLVFAALGGAALAGLVVFWVTRPSETTHQSPAPASAVASQDPAPETIPPAPTPAEHLTVTHCITAGVASPCERTSPLMTGVAESQIFRLSDGTTLTLDQQSELVLEVGRSLRVLRGEARFDVVKQADLPPLMVHLPNGAAEVLGTELHVRAGESLSVVEVLRGLVSVDNDDQKARVGAGFAAWLVPGKAPVVRASTPANDDERLSSDLGFGTLRARRPGGKTDAERPLRLTDHQVTVRLQGAFAKTTIEEAFASDEPHELEGIYRFTLPPGAQVAELSLLVDGRWEEGAFVERERAEKIWAGVIRNATPIVKRHEVVEYIWVPGPWRDPALLSFSQGNTFELRIFPIPARGERRVRIAYTETLPLASGARRYTLPLPSDGSNIRAGRFALDLVVGGKVPRRDVRIENYELVEQDEAALRFTKEARDFKPTGDLVVEVPEPEAAGDVTAFGWGRGEGATREGYVALGLRPGLDERHSDEGPLDLVVIVDTSYSVQRTRLERAADFVDQLVASLSPNDHVQVLACATTCRPLGGFEPASAEAGRDHHERISRLEALGSTRLAAAVKAADELLERRGKPAAQRRIIYVGDGIQTVGELAGDRAGKEAADAAHGTRVTAVAVGGETDPAALAAMTASPGGTVLDATLVGSVRSTATLAARRQRGLPLTNVSLELPEGLHATAPALLGDLWPGDERFVTAKVQGLDTLDGEVVLRGLMGDEKVERRWRVAASLDERAAHGFVPRLWAERRIADLSLRDDESSRKEVIQLSESHHVLSRHTALLVLESPAMARAFDVAPTRPIADWDAEGDIQAGASDLLEAAGGLAANEEDLADTDAPAGKSADAVGGGRVGNLSKAGETREKGESLREARQPSMRPIDPRDPRLLRPDGFSSGGAYVPMRKVWFKEATIAAGSRERDSWAERQLERRQQALDESPDSRERTLAVIRTFIRLRELDRATRLTERWLERDRMDPEALLTLADLALLEGDLERAEALVASAIEANPRNPALHARLARLYTLTGRSELACEHRLSHAQTAKMDTSAQAQALRCLDGAERERLLSTIDPQNMRKIERLLDAPSTTISGPFSLDASWEGGDVDLAVIDPDGRVTSWLGGSELHAEQVLDPERERLAFRGRQNGRWQVLLVRRDDGNGAVTGSLRLTAHGNTRRINFNLGAEEPIRFIADIEVQARFRYEPL